MQLPDIDGHEVLQRLRAEAPRYSQMLPQLPRLVHQALSQTTSNRQTDSDTLQRLLREQKRTNLLLSLIVYFGGGVVGGILLAQLLLHWQPLLLQLWP